MFDSVSHPVGTWRMQSGPMRGGGPRLRVLGVDGPPGVDASIIPAIVGGSTNPPTIMLAERAADLTRHGA